MFMDVLGRVLDVFKYDLSLTRSQMLVFLNDLKCITYDFTWIIIFSVPSLPWQLFVKNTAYSVFAVEENGGNLVRLYSTKATEGSQKLDWETLLVLLIGSLERKGQFSHLFKAAMEQRKVEIRLLPSPWRFQGRVPLTSMVTIQKDAPSTLPFFFFFLKAFLV